MEMPLDELGLRVLARLGAQDWKQRGQRPNRAGSITTWVIEWHNAGGASGRSQNEIVQIRLDWSERLGEAWDWLRAEKLVAQAVPPFGNPDAFFITEAGHEALAEEDPRALLRSRRRLGVELHPRLEKRLRSLTRAGAFEQAAFDALREVEVRVRDLADEPRNSRGALLVGADLMHQAFKEGGPLADPHAEAGERVGVMELFAGAFGAVRNPLGHRTVEWDDPTEAAEMVLLADLLMRQLDRVERRLA